MKRISFLALLFISITLSSMGQSITISSFKKSNILSNENVIVTQNSTPPSESKSELKRSTIHTTKCGAIISPLMEQET